MPVAARASFESGEHAGAGTPFYSFCKPSMGRPPPLGRPPPGRALTTFLCLVSCLLAAASASLAPGDFPINVERPDGLSAGEQPEGLRLPLPALVQSLAASSPRGWMSSLPRPSYARSPREPRLRRGRGAVDRRRAQPARLQRRRGHVRRRQPVRALAPAAAGRRAEPQRGRPGGPTHRSAGEGGRVGVAVAPPYEVG